MKEEKRHCRMICSSKMHSREGEDEYGKWS